MDQNTLSVIMAGGKSSRMGQDKTLAVLHNRPLIIHIIERLQPQSSQIAINSNIESDFIKKIGLPIIADHAKHKNTGPLSGIAASLAYAACHGFDRIITVAIDTPFFPTSYIADMHAESDKAPEVPLIARNQDGLQPTFGLWPVALLPAFLNHLEVSDDKSIRSFAYANKVSFVDFSKKERHAFFNINTLQDLAYAHNFLKDM